MLLASGQRAGKAPFLSWYVESGWKLKPQTGLGVESSDRPDLPRSLTLFRTRAIQLLLIEDIGGIGRTPEGLQRALELLERARKKALAAVAIDWLAILILVVLRAGKGAILNLGPTEEGVFALGLLAIAAHSGFRLGQIEKLSGVKRSVLELGARSASTDSEAAESGR